METGALALPAGFGTNSAVMARVPFALIGAQAAEVGTSFQHLHHQG